MKNEPKNEPKNDNLEKKYRHAILVLQAIAQRDGGYRDGVHDEWTEAEAFIDCTNAAFRALKYLGEPTHMPNWKAPEMSRETIPVPDLPKCYWDELTTCDYARKACETCAHLPAPEKKTNGNKAPVPLDWMNYGVEQGQLWPKCPACGKLTFDANRCFFCGQSFLHERGDNRRCW